MRHRRLEYEGGFGVVLGNRRSQAAVMVLAPGETVGGPENRHRESDQWLYVVSGQGIAVIEGEEVKLTGASLLLIEHGEGHEIRNTGRGPLETLNLYVPPAY
jgi:mannose-6-phosphate isomerase-like protein (cupin superfamily)